MTKELYKCPFCNVALAFKKNGDDQLITCPNCKKQAKSSEFVKVFLKKINCPSCNVSLSINPNKTGDLTCPKCNQTHDISAYQESSDPNKTLVKNSFFEKAPSQKFGKLILIEGECSPSVIILQKGENAIGRKAGSIPASIPIETQDAYMSKLHINIDMIVKSNNSLEYRLSDAGSKNKTRLNDEEMEPDEIMILNHGDIIQIGRTKFKFVTD